MKVAMVTAQFCMEHTFIRNCYTVIYKQFGHIFLTSFSMRATRLALKESSVFVPGHSDGPAALGIIR